MPTASRQIPWQVTARGVRHLNELANKTVVQIDEARFRPCLEAPDLRPKGGLKAEELVGHVLLAETGNTYLGVSSHHTDPNGACRFLDVCSGNLLEAEPKGAMLVSAAWEVVLEHPGVPPEVLCGRPAHPSAGGS